MTNMTNSTIITPRKTTIITIFVKNELRNGKNQQFKPNSEYRGEKMKYMLTLLLINAIVLGIETIQTLFKFGGQK